MLISNNTVQVLIGILISSHINVLISKIFPPSQNLFITVKLIIFNSSPLFSSPAVSFWNAEGAEVWTQHTFKEKKQTSLNL